MRNHMSTKHIVVMDKGFVFYGEISYNSDTFTIKNAYNIRRFGTERGLGQLSFDGPTKETVLDRVNTITGPMASLVFVIECAAEWNIK